MFFKKQILSILMLASAASVFADFGGGFAGGFTGSLVGGTLAGKMSGGGDPVAAEEARDMREERNARKRRVRDKQNRIRKLRRELRNAERKGDKAKAANLQKKIDALEEDINDEQA